MSISSTLTAPRPLVLLVDDTQSVLRLLERSLERHAFDILTAMDGGEALVAAAGSQRRVDLAVLDLILPDMAGEDLAAELRLGQPDSGCSSRPALSPDRRAPSSVIRCSASRSARTSLRATCARCYPTSDAPGGRRTSNGRAPRVR